VDAVAADVDRGADYLLTSLGHQRQVWRVRRRFGTVRA
jgi:hypothetical protein